MVKRRGGRKRRGKGDAGKEECKREGEKKKRERGGIGVGGRNEGDVFETTCSLRHDSD